MTQIIYVYSGIGICFTINILPGNLGIATIFEHIPYRYGYYNLTKKLVLNKLLHCLIMHQIKVFWPKANAAYGVTHSPSNHPSVQCQLVL